MEFKEFMTVKTIKKVVDIPLGTQGMVWEVTNDCEYPINVKFFHNDKITACAPDELEFVRTNVDIGIDLVNEINELYDSYEEDSE